MVLLPLPLRYFVPAIATELVTSKRLGIVIVNDNQRGFLSLLPATEDTR
jgi:hypothetical protein